MTALVWFRSDLRVDDNTALHAALGADRRLAAVFYATPAQWRTHDMAPVKVEFLWRNLECLRAELARRHIPLLVRSVPDFAAAAADLPRLAAELSARAVYANREYGVDELRRDAAAQRQLADAGVAWHCFDDATLLPPGSVRTLQGQPYKVFTPFRRAVMPLLAEGVDCGALRGKADAWREADPLPPYPYDASAVPAELWPAGEQAAARRLRDFVDTRIGPYKTQRDVPALDGTSGLSPYLALGVISVRRCVEAALVARAASATAEGAQTWLDELLWREFYIHVLAEFPRVAMHRPWRVATAALPWRHDADEFARWRDGRTGFPLIDAAQRQLLQTGWMHNRLRMVVAMFLCKYLLLDWRDGERHFMRHLVDGDLAANNGGWQWCASTGTDAVPYFRLLSPVRQAERFDADAAFCKRFLPELRAVPPRIVLQPGHPQLLAAGYPAPMVDLRVARERAIATFAAVARAAGDGADA